MTGLVVIVMGVSGVGKTTIGEALAERLGAAFAEGDSYHPAENVEKMRRGQPLSDEDRWPWLDRLRTDIERWLNDGERVVLACSALKESYRERLTGGSERARVIYLHAGKDLIADRLASRQGHYMPASLLESQLAALEPPADAITVDTSRPLDEIMTAVEEALDLPK